MIYFAHRRADDNVKEFFLKQPAGPYSSRATYQGLERIAQQQGYVKKVGTGFLAGDNIGKIDQYVSRYPVCIALDWVVGKFRYRKNEDLELLATVDFAALELIQHGKTVTMDGVKNVIATSSKWAAKLNREIFSDDSITQALSELRQLFPKSYA